MSALAIAHAEFDKVYRTSLKKAQEMEVAVAGCTDSTGTFEAAKIDKSQRFKTKNFRFESTLSAIEIHDTLVWLERCRQFYIDLYQVPERLLDYSGDPMVFVMGNTDAQKDSLIDACTGIPEKEKSFKKKFGVVAVGSRLQIGRFQNGDQAQRECVHIATHTFTRDTLGNHAPWLFEGLANSVAAAIRGSPLKVCFSGEGSVGGIHLEDIAFDQGPALLRDLVKKGKDSPISEFVKLPSDGMSPQQIAKAWSVVMFLLEMDRIQARDYFAAAGQGNGDGSKDDKVVLQFFPNYPTLKDLDVAWRAWAVDAYKK